MSDSEVKKTKLNIKVEQILANDHEFVRGTMHRVSRTENSVLISKVPDTIPVHMEDLQPAEISDEDREHLESKVSTVGQTKHFVKRVCAETGSEFWVATSDLHQTMLCPEARAEARKVKTREARKAKRLREKERIAQLEAENAKLKGEHVETDQVEAEQVETEQVEQVDKKAKRKARNKARKSA